MESILFEIEIVAKPYSGFRGAAKWRSKREACSSHSNVISSDGANVIVFREYLGVLDYYPIASLIKRVEIKRSASYFHYTNLLWNVVNPASLRMISKEVHEIIVSTFYKLNPQSLGNPGLVEVFSRIDNGIDFSGKTGLTFSEFYDILFEITDGLAKSSLVNEYCRAIQNAIKSLKGSALFCSLNLYNKRHLKETQRASYHPWMISLLRSITPSQTYKVLPEIFKKINPPKEYFKEKGKESGMAKPASFTDFKRKEAGILPAGSFVDIRKKSKSPVRIATPKMVRERGRKHFESFELRGLKASISPLKGLVFD